MKTVTAKCRIKGASRKAKPAACEACPIACGQATGDPAPAKTGGARCRVCPAACCRTRACAGRVRDGRQVFLICVSHRPTPGKMRRRVGASVPTPLGLVAFGQWHDA